MDGIESCPLCGRDAHAGSLMVDEGWWSAQVWCDGSEDGTCGMRVTCGAESEELAVEMVTRAWNRIAARKIDC